MLKLGDPLAPAETVWEPRPAVATTSTAATSTSALVTLDMILLLLAPVIESNDRPAQGRCLCDLAVICFHPNVNKSRLESFSAELVVLACCDNRPNRNTPCARAGLTASKNLKCCPDAGGHNRTYWPAAFTAPQHAIASRKPVGQLLLDRS
jgi:hypothetical protein